MVGLQHDGIRNSVWSSRSPAGEAWGDATPLEDSSQVAFWAQVALDDGGDAVVVWKQLTAGRGYRVLASTGRTNEAAYLKQLGASEILRRC